MFMSRLHRRAVALIAAIVSSLILAACSNSASSGSGDMPTIRVAYAQGLQANFYYALQNGLFAKHGVKVEGTKFDSGPALVTALVGGSADVGYFGAPAMATANEQGAQLQVFDIANNAGDMAGLYVKPDSGIHSIKDLKGKTVATTQNTVAHIFLLIALEKAGMSPSDVHIQFLDTNGLVAGFTRGDLNAVMMFASVGAKLISSGGELVKGTTSTDLGVPDTGNFIASKQYIQGNTPALQKFLAALDEATPIVNQNKDKYIAALKAGIGLDSDQAQTIYNDQPSPCLLSSDLADPSSKFALTPGGGFTKITQQLTDTMTKMGILKSKPNVADYITSAVVGGMHK